MRAREARRVAEVRAVGRQAVRLGRGSGRRKPGPRLELFATLGNALRRGSFCAARAPKLNSYSDEGLGLNQVFERGPFCLILNQFSERGL